MRRLLCIVSSMDVGGAETFLMKIYRKIDREKYQFDFVVNCDGFYDNEIKEMGGLIYKIPMHTQAPIKAFIEISHIVRKYNYKYMIKMGAEPIVVIDVIAAKTGGIKHTIVRSCNSASEEGTGRKIINKALRPILNTFTEVKIAPSKIAAEYTFGKSQVKVGRVEFIHNAIDLKKFRYSKEEREKIRDVLGLKGKFIIGHIGRFTRQKNHEFLLKIFKLISEKEENAVLLLVGKGELEEVIREKIKELKIEDRVQLLGIRKDIQELLLVIDVMVFPSFYEGMPNVIIEAQATGLPCILSDSITEEVDLTGLVQYISLNASIELWADRILQIMSVGKTREGRSKELREKGYDIENESKKFLNLVFRE